MTAFGGGSGGSIGTAFVTVRPNTSGFEAEARTGVLGPATRVAAGVALAFAAHKVKDWLGGAIAEATEAQRVGKQTEAVIRSTGGAAGVTANDVGRYADALSRVAGVDDEVIQSGANMLLTFKNIGGEIFGRTLRATTDLAAGMAAASGGTIDLKGASIQMGKALNDPIAGMTALTRVGVQFTAEQKAQIEAMVASGDLLGAQKIILGEVESQFKGSAAAQATAAMKMQVAYGNLKETIGTALLPVIAGLVSILQPAVEWLTKHKEVAMLLAGVIGGVLVAALAAYTVGMINAAFATTFAAGPIGLIVVGILALIATVVLFYTQWDTIWNWIAAHPAYAIIIALLLSFLAPFLLLAAGIGALAANWQAAWNWIKQAASDAYNGVIAPVLSAIGSAIDFIKAAVSTLGDAFSTGFGAAKAVVDSIGGAIRGVLQGITDAINVVKDALASVNPLDTSGGPRGSFGYGLGGRASGGPASGWTKVGEDGEELVHLPYGSHVFSTKDSAQMLGAGAGETKVTVESGALDRAAARLERAAALLAGERGPSPHEIAVAGRLA